MDLCLVGMRIIIIITSSTFLVYHTVKPLSTLSRDNLSRRHTNGVAIYYHKDTSVDALDGVGGEYMASSIVRGSPTECVNVLMNPASNTTILGPASEIEILESTEDRQVGGQPCKREGGIKTSQGV